ncbi:hypothetical protein LTR36_001707, partial [Oleoguttula mirabilis]
GPIAVPAHELETVLRVQTRVNGELRQDATTDTLIFGIPHLIQTLSEGQTLMPGDVLATGTPAGVGIGRKPPIYLQPGDEISVSITGLGTLTNRVAAPTSVNPTLQRVQNTSSLRATNAEKTLGGAVGLTSLNGKPTHLVKIGTDTGRPPIVFIHGLGGTLDYWTPLLHHHSPSSSSAATSLAATHACYLFDFEGHGLSPTSPQSKISITSLAADVRAIFDHAGIEQGGTLIAHSMGCLVALTFVLANPGRVGKLVLIGPPPSPLPQAGSQGAQARAALVRREGMPAVVDAVAKGGTSATTQSANGLAVTAVRLSLLGQDPEGYAKACVALAEATQALDVGGVEADVLVVTGREDKVSPVAVCEKYVQQPQQQEAKRRRELVVLPDVGHWHVFEDTKGVAEAVSNFI